MKRKITLFKLKPILISIFLLFGFLVSNAQNPPNATNDVNTVDQDVTLNVPAAGVLANDTDPDVGDVLTVSQFVVGGTTYATGATANIAEGSITIDSDGSYSFVPAVGYYGAVPDITYTVSDGTGRSDTGILYLTVEEAGDNTLQVSISSCNQGYTPSGRYKITYSVTLTNTSIASGYSSTSQITNIQLYDDLEAVFGDPCIVQIDRNGISTSHTLDNIGGYYPQDWDGSSWDASEFDATDATPGADGLFLASESSNILYPRQSITVNYCVYVDPACAGGLGVGSGNGVAFDNVVTTTSSSGSPTANINLTDFHTTGTNVSANFYVPVNTPVVNYDGTWDFTNTVIIKNDGAAQATNVQFYMPLFNFLQDGITFSTHTVSQVSGPAVTVNAAYNGDDNTSLISGAGATLNSGDVVILQIYYVVDPTTYSAWNTFDVISPSMTQGAPDGHTENPLRQAYVEWHDSEGDHLDRYYNATSATDEPSSEDQCSCQSQSMRFPYTISLTLEKTITSNNPALSGVSGSRDVVFKLKGTNNGTSTVHLEDVILRDDFNSICGGNIANVGVPVILGTSTATTNPNLNAAYDGLTDVRIFDEASGVIDPGQFVEVEIEVEIEDYCEGTNDATFGGNDPTNTAVSQASDDSWLAVLTPIEAVDDDYTGTPVNGTTGAVVGDITSNDLLDAVLNDDGNLNITILTQGGSGAFVDANGNLSIPAGIIAGNYTITYRICQKIDPDNCDDATVLITVYTDNDGDGLSDALDVDDDDDGILDVDENNGVDPSIDSDGDGTADIYDTDTPGFVDSNGDGVDDRADTDLDGVPDYIDLDADNDGIPDLVEAGGVDTNGDGVIDDLTDTDGDGLADTYDTDDGGNDISNQDTDGDGINDYVDLDSDNDGIPDVVEAGGTDANGDGIADNYSDADGDGFNDVLDSDLDNDGTIDNSGNELQLTGADTDADGVPNSYPEGDTDNDGHLDQLDLDADNDGIPDVVEAGGTDVNGDGVLDGYVDGDSDGFNDTVDTDLNNDGTIDNAGSELQLTGADTDGDGAPNSYPEGDFDEDGNLDQLDVDSDNDGITDVTEAGGTDVNGDGIIDAYADTDNDGFSDNVDTNNGGTSLPIPNTDGSGNPNYIDIDADDDGIPDNIEGQATVGYVVPTGTDSDGDGLDDAYDPDNVGNVMPITNTDGVDNPDYLDVDSDNDGIPDIIENGDNNVLSGTDTDGDGLDNNMDDDNASSVGSPANVNDGINPPNNTNLGDVDGDWNTTGDVDYRDILDTDGDGIADINDIDDDNDGILDVDENNGINPTTDTDGDGIIDIYDNDTPGFVDVNNDGLDDRADNDGDGVANYVDLDSDNDGIPDIVEAGGVDTDGDGVIDGFVDTDGDGLGDTYDTDNGGDDISNNDTDGDGVADYLDLDSDNDGIPDVVEAGGTDANGDGIADNFSDGDGDGFNDVLDSDLNNDGAIDNAGNELQLTGADTDGDGAPNSYPEGDNDGDGVLDQLDLDSDNDGIYDTVESGGTDTDNDGIIDSFGTDTDNDGFADAVDGDVGNDGVAENTAGALIVTGVDTDNNGAPDSYPNGDTDGDNILDQFELDSDNDGCNDVTEAGFTDNNGDGILGDNPVTEDQNGVVTSGTDGYTEPNDGNGANGYDFQESGTIASITTHPIDESIGTGTNATFTVVDAGSDLVYQWQELTTGGGAVWTNVTDGGIYSGATTGTLDLTSVPDTYDGYQYRVIITSSSYACSNITSNAATLNVSNDADIYFTKTVDNATPDAGDNITFTITIFNDGPAVASNVVVTDDFSSIAGLTYSSAGAPSQGSWDNVTYQWSVGTLNPGTSALITITATVDAGTEGQTITNTVTNTQDQTDSGVTLGDPTEDVIVNDPQLEATKISVLTDNDGNTVASLGDVITYTITVENTGNVSLTGVSLSDTFEDADGNPLVLTSGTSFVSSSLGSVEGTLQVGETATYTATYLIAQNAVDVGGVNNSVVASGASSTGINVSDTSDDGDDGDGNTTDDVTETDIPESPSLEATKTFVLTDNDGNTVASLGDVITYTITVENTGNVTLTGVSLLDIFEDANGNPLTLTSGTTFVSSDAGSAEGTLQVGETATYTATYLIAQNAVDAGGVNNNVVASGTTHQGTDVNDTSDDGDDGDGNTTDDVTETDIPESPSLEATKTFVLTDNDGNTVASLGDVITYTITVENTGNVTLTGVSLLDTFEDANGNPLTLTSGTTFVSADAGSAEGTLQVGEIATYSATYTIAQDAVDAGGVNNSVVASGTSPQGTGVNDTSDDGDDTDGNTSDDVTETDIPESPSLEATKTFVLTDNDGNTVASLGDVITYTITVENTGNVTLTGVSLLDTFVDANGNPLTLTSGTTFVSADAGSADGTLQVGEIATYSATYMIAQDAVDAGGVNNSVVASGTSPQGTGVNDTSDDGDDTDGNTSDDETITDISELPSLEATKTFVVADNGDGLMGIDDVITYTITVENTGNVTLTGVSINDTFVDANGNPLTLTSGTTFVSSDAGSAEGTLQVGETATYTATYTIAQNAVDAGGVNNSVVASGTSPQGTGVTDTSDDGDDTDGNTSDDETITDISELPSLEATKTFVVADNGDGVMGLDDVITYTITVENTGNVTLTGVSINDTFEDANGNPLVLTSGTTFVSSDAGSAEGTLQVGETATYTATYTINQVVVDAGGVSNSVVASGTSPSGTGVTDTSDDGDDTDGNTSDDETITDISELPSLEATKISVVTDNGDGVMGLDDVITYTITVENTGNVTLTGVSINDTFEDATGSPVTLTSGTTFVSSDAGSAEGTLQVGETATYTATYTIDQVVVDAGGVSNSVVASGTSPQGTDVTDTSDDGDDTDDNTSDDSTDDLIPENPSIEAVKVSTLDDVDGNGEVSIDDILTYTITVQNTGNVTLSAVSIDDNLVDANGNSLSLSSGTTFVSSDMGSSEGILQVGETATYTATYEVEQDAVDAGGVSNSVIAHGTSPQGTDVNDTSDDGDDTDGNTSDDSTDSDIPQHPSMSIIKSATIPEIVKEGAIIEYSIEVTNTGNVTIRNIEITDANAVITDGNPIAILAPGASEIVTAEHIITYSDIVAGKIVNTAYGVGDSPSGIDDVTDTSDTGTEMNGDEIVSPEDVETPNSDGTTNNNATDDPTITEVIFSEITIPEGFSPNGDGINDNFVIRGLEKYPDNILVIFNRWGNKVYEADGYLNDWNGKSMFGVTVGGNDLPEGTYFYILKPGKEQTPIKGYVYLKR